MNILGIPITDWIQAFVAMIGIVISTIALWQSNKSIKEANRAVVSIYLDHIQLTNNVHEYLVIKNFGKSPAQVNSITSTKDISFLNSTPIFQEGFPFVLAPNQSFSIVLRHDALSQDQEAHNIELGKFDMTIKYSDESNHYIETFKLNQEQIKNLILTKSNGVNSLSKNYHPLERSLLRISEEVLRKKL